MVSACSGSVAVWPGVLQCSDPPPRLPAQAFIGFVFVVANLALILCAMFANIADILQVLLTCGDRCFRETPRRVCATWPPLAALPLMRGP